MVVKISSRSIRRRIPLNPCLPKLSLLSFINWDGEVDWGPERMKVFQVYMALIDVEIWARSDLALVSKFIAVSFIQYGVGPESLRTCVCDVAKHSNVSLGDCVAN